MRIRTLVLAGAAAAAVAYLIDPRHGRARRRRMTDAIRSLPRRWASRGDRSGPAGDFEPLSASTTERAQQLLEAATAPPIPLAAPEPVTSEATEDARTVDLVKSKLEERGDLPTDELVVDVINGVAYLSGDLRDGHTFGEIVELTREVPGVRRVQSLLHLPDSDTVERDLSARRLGPDGAG